MLRTLIMKLELRICMQSHIFLFLKGCPNIQAPHWNQNQVEPRLQMQL